MRKVEKWINQNTDNGKTKYHCYIRWQCFGLPIFTLNIHILSDLSKSTIFPYIYIYIYIRKISITKSSMLLRQSRYKTYTYKNHEVRYLKFHEMCTIIRRKYIYIYMYIYIYICVCVCVCVCV